MVWNRRDLGGLAANVATAVGVAALANTFVYFVNPGEDLVSPASPWQPPGWVIGLVWVCLFSLMGAARWLLIGGPEPNRRGALWVVLLLLACAAYPVYTSGLKSLPVGLAGNIATAVFALAVALLVRKTSALAACLVSTVAVWVVFAGFLILDQMKRQHP